MGNYCRQSSEGCSLHHARFSSLVPSLRASRHHALAATMIGNGVAGRLAEGHARCEEACVLGLRWACAAFCTSSAGAVFVRSQPDPLHLVLNEPRLRAVVQLGRARALVARNVWQPFGAYWRSGGKMAKTIDLSPVTESRHGPNRLRLRSTIAGGAVSGTGEVSQLAAPYGCCIQQGKSPAGNGENTPPLCPLARAEGRAAQSKAINTAAAAGPWMKPLSTLPMRFAGLWDREPLLPPLLRLGFFPNSDKAGCRWQRRPSSPSSSMTRICF
jgi:hypothetical protein